MKHRPVKQSSVYEVVEDQVKRKRKSCPRCGEGFWMAPHKEKGKTRYYCGRCHLTTWE